MRARWMVALLAVTLTAVPIVAGVVIGSATVPASASGPLLLTPQRLGGAPASLPHAHQSGSALPPGSGALIAVVRRPTEMRLAPGGALLAPVPLTTPFGSPQVLWVVQRRGGWLGVASPLAGNDRLGWIPQAATRLARDDYELRVSLSQRRLTVLQAGQVREQYMVAIGAPDAPTPTGRFAVTDRLTTGDPSGPYGCCILALSAQAPHAIQGWTGGNRIAIHSTPETWTIGRPDSHGCLRLTLAEGRWLLAHIPLGTPTLIGT